MLPIHSIKQWFWHFCEGYDPDFAPKLCHPDISENFPDDLTFSLRVVLMKLCVIFDPPRHPRKCLKVATVKVLRRTFWLQAGKIMRKWSATPLPNNETVLPLLAECKDPSSGSDLLPPGSWQVQIGRRQESSLQSAIRSLVAGYKWFSKFLVNSVVGLNQP